MERLTLHRGLEHWSDIGEAERTAFHDARADEQDALSSFRLRALACIVALYFGFLFLYATFAI
ncbi:C2H2-type zinc finger protein [Halobacterium sp. KA-6]|uniref:C2H2-type zinc finger protein n=1 Tax=Halobacterium sp. KA-6 TaxID=2896368 RepID=UPI001E5A5E64|nr:C2H2-type zinc finger protein [Halobacterium sp. KA-6]MCD2203720.1 C2H2-type zinc finger protein [Halobacterium sp. KA-6]